MPGLLDIAPPEVATKKFEIRGGTLEVRALRNIERAMLMRRFPQLRALGERSAAAAVTAPAEMAVTPVDPEMAIAGIELMSAVIAAGLGNVGDAKTEALIADRLTDEEQAEVFHAIMGLTPAPLAGSPAEAGQDANGAQPMMN